ncbi:MAG TPA: hypothetical protein VGR73_12780 [Bryobacteraceae bacterium]|nr:hypothetical protein [Bryobacteraceae bacterium]
MRIARIPAGGSAVVALTFLICAMAGTASAQWFSIPISGTPRTPDGKPNLNAAVPRTADGKPDLTGIWQADSPRWNENLAPQGTDAPLLPAAAELYKHRVETLGWNRPMTYCMPHGVPDAMTVAGLPFKILQMPGVTVVLFEEFHMYRQIHTDGRKLPVNPEPAWYGYSIGRWEGDTLVAETAGYREGSWLDNGGHPHSDALRTAERFRRVNFGHLEVDVTIDDPKTYSRPWTSDTMHFTLQPDTELLEHFCENNKDLPVLERVYGAQERDRSSKSGKQ